MKNPGEETPQESLTPDEREELILDLLPPKAQEIWQEEGMNQEWLQKHPGPEPLKKQEIDPAMEKFNKLLEEFEATHSLEALHAVTLLEPQDAPNHPVREPARKALIPIAELLKKLPESKELQTKYMRLSRAVGIISWGIVDHTRKHPLE